MSAVTLTFTINIRASSKTIFEYVSNWDRQSDWIIFTSVRLLSTECATEGANLLAVTGMGRFKVVDTMVVTKWEPFHEIIVEHTGRIVLGKGVFTIRQISDELCEFSWQEITPVPFGYAGRLGLFIIKPIMRLLFDLSLRRLKQNIEAMD